MSRVRRQDSIKCCYLGSYVKTLTSGHVVAPNYEGESMPIRDHDGHRAMQAAGKALHEGSEVKRFISIVSFFLLLGDAFASIVIMHWRNGRAV